MIWLVQKNYRYVNIKKLINLLFYKNFNVLNEINLTLFTRAFRYIQKLHRFAVNSDQHSNKKFSHIIHRKILLTTLDSFAQVLFFYDHTYIFTTYTLHIKYIKGYNLK